VTALDLVERLLNEAESPKKALRAVTRSPKRIPQPNEVEYDLEADWEQESPEGHFDDPQDVAFVRRQIERGNVWGWCYTKVTARWVDPEGNTWEGDDYLGGCSYLSRGDFMRGDYYQDMKNDAYQDLVKQLTKAGFH
jgi:hypothetical protein